MLHEKTKHLKAAGFKRMFGVNADTFRTMVQEIKRKEKENSKYPLRRRPSRFTVEDQVLIALMYWREYRTMFHIGGDYGVSEATISRIITKVENILSKSKKFQLPGKKVLEKNKFSYEVFVIDSTETPIERPKKNSSGIIPAKRRNTH